MVARVKPIGISGVNSGRTTKVFADFNKSMTMQNMLKPASRMGLTGVTILFHEQG